MTLFHTDRSCKRPLFVTLVAALCVLLVLFVGAAQMLHTHAANEGANPACSLCAVAHLAALPAPGFTPAISAQLVLLLQQATAAHAPPRFVSLSLYVRPPPDLTTLA